MAALKDVSVNAITIEVETTAYGFKLIKYQ